MSVWLYAFLGSALFVGLKSWQQQNVIFRAWWWVFPTSVAMAFCEVKVVGAIALEVQKTGLNSHIWIPVGVGAGLGCLTAMWIHSRYITK